MDEINVVQQLYMQPIRLIHNVDEMDSLPLLPMDYISHHEVVLTAERDEVGALVGLGVEVGEGESVVVVAHCCRETYRGGYC